MTHRNRKKREDRQSDLARKVTNLKRINSDLNQERLEYIETIDRVTATATYLGIACCALVFVSLSLGAILLTIL